MFYGLEQGPKVSGSETLVVSSLNDLVEDSRFILGGLGEDLKKVSLVIVVNEDLLLLQDVDVFLNLNVDLSQSGAEVIVVGVGDL